MENKIKIQRAGLRPYMVFVESGKYQISKIKIYNRNGVIFAKNRGWFENAKHGRREDIMEIEVSKPKLRRKENFSRDEVFIIPEKRDRLDMKFGDRKAILYIPESEAEVRYMGQQSKEMGDSETYHYDLYGIKLSNVGFVEEKINRVEKTEFGKEVEKMYNKVKEKMINISRYDLEKLMKHFEIKEREDK